MKVRRFSLLILAFFSQHIWAAESSTQVISSASALFVSPNDIEYLEGENILEIVGQSNSVKLKVDVADTASKNENKYFSALGVKNLARWVLKSSRSFRLVWAI